MGTETGDLAARVPVPDENCLIKPSGDKVSVADRQSAHALLMSCQRVHVQGSVERPYFQQTMELKFRHLTISEIVSSYAGKQTTK